MLDKIELDDIRPSSRKYPFVNFLMDREIGNDVLQVKDLSYSIEDEKLFSKDDSSQLTKKTKLFLLGDRLAKSALLRVLAEEEEAQEGSIRWGVTTYSCILPSR